MCKEYMQEGEEVLRLRRFYNSIARDYIKKYRNQSINFMRYIEFKLLKEYVERERIGLALDIGCGPGIHVNYLKALGVKCVGIDIADRFLGKGCVCGDMHMLPFKNCSFDMAFSFFCVLNHASDLLRVLREVWRVLKDSSVFMFTVANRKSIFRKGRVRKFFVKEAGGYNCIRCYSRKEVSRAVLDAGFQIERIGGIFLFLKPYYHYSDRIVAGKDVIEVEDKTTWMWPKNEYAEILIYVVRKAKERNSS